MFNLKDIDVAKIASVSNPSFRGTTVNLKTTNDRPLVTNGIVLDNGTFAKQSFVDDDSRRAYVVLPDSEAAKRVAKAFQHAVVLCGGKASPF